MNLSSVSHNIINHMSNYWTRFHPAGWEEKEKKLENKKTGALRGDVYDKYISSFT